jgi:hypothetical protein
MKGSTQYEYMRSMMDMSRKLFEAKQRPSIKKFMLTEEEQKRDAIAITNDARFGQSVLQGQIDSFKQTVNAGAKFAKENADEPENNPLVYYPKTGNLVFSGSIPQLNNLKFQFSLNDTTGSPYIFVDGLCLSEDAIKTLSKLRGFFLNWRDEWENSGDLLDKLH